MDTLPGPPERGGPARRRGKELHRWVFELEAWRRQQGQEGGQVNASTPVVEAAQVIFVTEGIESALEQARQATDGRDAVLGGGANVVPQYLAAGLVDEFELHVVPSLLGDGERLLENVGTPELEQVRAIEAPGVTHIKYRIVNEA